MLAYGVVMLGRRAVYAFQGNKGEKLAFSSNWMCSVFHANKVSAKVFLNLATLDPTKPTKISSSVSQECLGDHRRLHKRKDLFLWSVWLMSSSACRWTWVTSVLMFATAPNREIHSVFPDSDQPVFVVAELCVFV